MRCVAFLVLAGMALAANKSPFAFREVNGVALELTENGQPVFDYNYGMVWKEGFPESMKRSSYLHPVYAPDGTLITDDFNKNHPHHRGIFWTWPVIVFEGKTYDTWEVDEKIKQRFEHWVKRETTHDGATLDVANGWYIGEKRIVKEDMEIHVLPTKNETRVIEFRWKVEADGKPVEIAGTPDDGKGYGGICFRMAARDGGTKGTTISTDKGVLAKDGVLEVAKWAEVSGTVQGKQESARLDDDPANPNFGSNGWLLRHSFGLLNPSYPGLPHLRLEPGKPLVLRYRVTLTSGTQTATK